MLTAERLPTLGVQVAITIVNCLKNSASFSVDGDLSAVTSTLINKEYKYNDALWSGGKIKNLTSNSKIFFILFNILHSKIEFIWIQGIQQNVCAPRKLP